MFKGIHLTLLVGPVVPIPVPKVVLDALESVSVTSAAGSSSGFQLNFTFSGKSPLNTIFVLAAGLNAGLGRHSALTCNNDCHVGRPSTSHF